MAKEKTFSKTIACGHCSNISAMEVIGSVFHNQAEDDEFDPKYGPPPDYGDYFDILLCPACKKENIVKYHWHDFMESDDEVTYSILYPRNKNIPFGLPDKIKSTFQAAEKVKTIDVNAYAILMRRLLELVCLDRNAAGDTLAKMLTDLANKNEIPTKLVNVAKGLKNFGNIGAHAGIGELSEKEIPIVNALTKAILEYIYSAPYLATLAETKLNEIKTKGKKKK